MLTDILNRIFILLLVTPVVLIALKNSKASGTQKLFLAAGLFVLDIIWFNLPVDLFKNSHWAWQATIAGTIWDLFFIYFLSNIPAKEFGLTIKFNKGTLQPFLLLTFVWGAVLFLVFYFFYNHRALTPEAFFFDLTMPGLSEELIYRGICLTLLNRVFTSRRRYLKANIGWGLIIVTVLYALANAVRVRDIGNFKISFDLTIFLFTLSAGFIFGYVKERTGSLFASFVSHNLWNTIVGIAQAIN